LLVWPVSLVVVGHSADLHEVQQRASRRNVALRAAAVPVRGFHRSGRWDREDARFGIVVPACAHIADVDAIASQ
jgi:diaminopimelate decarboxylase